MDVESCILKVQIFGLDVESMWRQGTSEGLGRGVVAM